MLSLGAMRELFLGAKCTALPCPRTICVQYDQTIDERLNKSYTHRAPLQPITLVDIIISSFTRQAAEIGTVSLGLPRRDLADIILQREHLHGPSRLANHHAWNSRRERNSLARLLLAACLLSKTSLLS
jgi:hypothetical protein